MRRPSRENLKLILVAAVCLTVGSAGPSVAEIVANADKVDGLHAVKSKASVDERKGKLVATSKKNGRLPNNIIKVAPNAKLLKGLTVKDIRMQWISFDAAGNVYDSSPGAEDLTVTHPAAGTYCLPADGIHRGSVSGAIQSQVNGFTDITLVITSLYNTSACPDEIRIYTARAGVLEDSPFTLHFQSS